MINYSPYNWGHLLFLSFAERFQQLQVTNNRQLIQEPILQAKGKQLQAPSQPKQLEETHNAKYEFEDYEEEEEEQEQESQEEYEDEEKTSYTTSTTPHSRCSRGVSTDELEEQPPKNPTTESTHHGSSPPSTALVLSADKTHVNSSNSTSKRFEDGDPIAPESAAPRNSVLLQLISCGNLAVAKAKGNAPSFKQSAKANITNEVKRSESNLHKGALYKSAVKVAEEDMIIKYMSENPRFGNLQAEEKEYFSGSIVESMSENRVTAEPGLKRSNSYNEER